MAGMSLELPDSFPIPAPLALNLAGAALSHPFQYAKVENTIVLEIGMLVVYTIYCVNAQKNVNLLKPIEWMLLVVHKSGPQGQGQILAIITFRN